MRKAVRAEPTRRPPFRDLHLDKALDTHCLEPGQALSDLRDWFPPEAEMAALPNRPRRSFDGAAVKPEPSAGDLG